MGNTVKLTVTGHQTDESGMENITETKAIAEYHNKNGTLYILYHELPEGTGTIVKNCIKLKNNILELTKKGPLNTRMVFDTAHEYRMDYQTPLGCLQMDIHTSAITCEFIEDLPQITAEYTLSTEENLLFSSRVSIKLQK